MLKSEEFNEEEFKEILRQGIELVRHGYFTGINFIKPEKPLPKESILIHFLHDSRIHLENIVQKLKLSCQIVPRYTFYILDPKYTTKENFEEEYRGAIFYDGDFNEISINEVLTKQYEKINVASNELDLILPYRNSSLLSIISDIKQADIEGPFPWIDPVIIIKTKHLFDTIPGFVNYKSYVSIMRNKEEFYTVLHDEVRANAFEKYLKNLCKRTYCVGNLTEHSILFYLSQINREFFEYIIKNVKPLEPLE